jgi:hypothetical protein
MGTPGSPFTPQPPDLVSVAGVTQQEVDPRKRAQLEALGHKDAGWWETLWSRFWHSVYDGVLLVVTEFADGLDQVLAFLGDFFVAAQGEKTPHFWDLAAVILEDLTGIKVDKAKLQAAAFGSGRLDAMQIFGGDLYNTLAQEFAPASGDLEKGDAGPAQRFLGFLMNFAIRQGNIEVLTGFLPEEIRFGEGFRAYGELMAKNLGLGRMARRALQPLIQILVADPLMYQLQQQYRPKRIGATPAIKKFFRDATFEQTMRTELAQEGYTDARIDDLIAELRPLPSDADAIRHYFRFGDTGVDADGNPLPNVQNQLTTRGYSLFDAQRLIDVARPVLDKAEIATLFVHQSMDQSTALLNLAKLGYDNATAQLVLDAHSLTHSHPKSLGLGELKKAFHNNVIDLLELKAHLTTLGFSADDQQIITLDLLSPAVGKVRQLSLAEIKAGFKAGALTEAQAASHLKSLGYSDADTAVILKSLPATKTTTTPAAPASSPTGTPGAPPTAPPTAS